ncbi:hypothetical protein ACWCQZ_43465 [Streptomyces sp. NPDC002285]
MAVTQPVARGFGEALEMVAGGDHQASLAEVVACVMQHRVPGGPMQGMLGTNGERLGVGAQGLDEVGVTLDRGPGG